VTVRIIAGSRCCNKIGPGPVGRSRPLDTDGCRIVLAHPDADRRAALTEILEGLGHDVVMAASNRSELVGAGIATEAELIVTAVQLTDGDGIDALLEIEKHAPLPAVVIARDEEMEEIEKALADHVMAFLAEPVTEDDLRPTIHLVRRRFEQFEDLRREIDDLREALAARKQIEKAKGKLMERHGLAEEDAYRRLQKMASSRRIKMIEVANAILLAEDVERDVKDDAPGRPGEGTAS